MRKLLYACIALTLSTGLFAQSYVAQVLVLNEGYFDYMTNEIITPVTIGSYDPALNVYTTVATVADARFASDIKVDGDVYYVAADQFLLKYDVQTHALLDMTTVPGIRKIGVSDDVLVITRGEYLVELPSYVQVYDKSTLDLSYEITADEIPYTTEGVVIRDGIAYIAVNNGFVFGSEVGMIAQLDLTSGTIATTTDLGADGINPDNLMIEGDYIYTLNNKDFTGSSVSAYKISTGTLTTTNLADVSSGCGTSAIDAGVIYYQELFGTTVSRFDPATSTTIGTDDFGISFYGLAFDPISNLMYTSETDYFSYGKVNVFEDADLIATFDAGISPGNFAFEVRTTSGADALQVSQAQVYPNPATSNLTVAAGMPAEQVIITDLSGKVMMTESGNQNSIVSMDIRTLPAGTYLISVTGADHVATSLFTKL